MDPILREYSAVAVATLDEKQPHQQQDHFEHCDGPYILNCLRWRV